MRGSRRTCDTSKTNRRQTVDRSPRFLILLLRSRAEQAKCPHGPCQASLRGTLRGSRRTCDTSQTNRRQTVNSKMGLLGSFAADAPPLPCPLPSGLRSAQPCTPHRLILAGPPPAKEVMAFRFRLGCMDRCVVSDWPHYLENDPPSVTAVPRSLR